MNPGAYWALTPDSPPSDCWGRQNSRGQDSNVSVYYKKPKQNKQGSDADWAAARAQSGERRLFRIKKEGIVWRGGCFPLMCIIAD